MPAVSDGSYVCCENLQTGAHCLRGLNAHRIHTMAEHEVCFLKLLLDGLTLPDLGRKEDNAAVVSTAISVMQMNC